VGRTAAPLLPQGWAASRLIGRSGLPHDPHVGAASDRFLATLPANAYVTVEEQGWHLSTDPAAALRPEDELGGARLRGWLREKMPTMRWPELLLAVEQTLDWTRPYLPVGGTAWPARPRQGMQRRLFQAFNRPDTTGAHGHW
jgi:hypothetical protein